ncbi:hypothetical protein M3J09_004780 [Ascochyta lentis]
MSGHRALFQAHIHLILLPRRCIKGLPGNDIHRRRRVFCRLKPDCWNLFDKVSIRQHHPGVIWLHRDYLVTLHDLRKSIQEFVRYSLTD